MSDEIKTFPQVSISKAKEGAFSRYTGRMIGKRDAVSFLVYELFTTLLAPIPGALGIALRSAFYPLMFRSFGKGVFIGRSVTVRHPGKIEIGDSTLIDDYSSLDSKSEKVPGITIGKSSQIGRGAIVSTGYFGSVSIGDGTIVGNLAIVHGPGGIRIGSGVLISDHATLNAGSHLYGDPSKPILDQGIRAEGIEVGDDVWIGTSAVIMDGTKLGKGVVVLAGSVVSGVFEDFSVISGNPAKVTGKRGSSS